MRTIALAIALVVGLILPAFAQKAEIETVNAKWIDSIVARAGPGQSAGRPIRGRLTDVGAEPSGSPADTPQPAALFWARNQQAFATSSPSRSARALHRAEDISSALKGGVNVYKR
jgi:hypothetical protein